MAAFILYLVMIGRGLAEVASMIITGAEVYKLYQDWLESRQNKAQPLKVIGLEAVA